MNLTFATKLTLIRLILSPILIPLTFVYLLPYNFMWLNALLTLLFLLLSITDFFDGYIARRMHMESPLGTVLDPIADKFLMYAVLISLLAVKKIFFGWVIILIGREFFMMGLRQVALENNFTLRVSVLGKLKTTLQVLCFSLIIFNPYQAVGLHIHNQGMWNVIELLLILLVVWISLFSAYHYYCAFMKQFQAIHAKHTNEHPAP